MYLIKVLLSKSFTLSRNNLILIQKTCSPTAGIYIYIAFVEINIIKVQLEIENIIKSGPS